MPWQKEPKKDVAGCDKPRRAVKQALTRGFPNGATYLDKLEMSVILTDGHLGNWNI